MPGVLEEAILTLRLGRPVLASAIFGGAAAFVGGLLNGDVTIDKAVSSDLKDPTAELRTLTSNSGAIPDLERQRLLKSRSIEECVELFLRGSINYWTKRIHTIPQEIGRDD